MHNEHHYHQEEESGAVIPSLSALISGAKRCQGEADALCPGHWKNEPSWEPRTSLYVLEHLTLPPAVLSGLWGPRMLVAAGHVCLGLAALPPAGNKGLGSVFCCGSFEGVMWGRALIRVGETIPIQGLGSFFFIFIAAFPAKWNGAWERLSLEHILLPELQAGQLQQADSDCLSFQQGPPLPYTCGVLPLI